MVYVSAYVADGDKVVGKADVHIHSTYSDGMASVEEVLDWVETRTTLDVIAIADHDEIGGALKARELIAKGNYRFDVVTGAEISTRRGHLLALYIDQPVPSYRPLHETVMAVQKLGGICIVPHPFSWLVTSVGERTMDRLMAHRNHGITGIEVANPTPAGLVTQAKAKRVNAERYQLSETGGSDAHFLQEIGSGYTEFTGKNGAELRHALETGATLGHRTTEKRDAVPTMDYVRQQGRSLVWLPYHRMRTSLRRARG